MSNDSIDGILDARAPELRAEAQGDAAFWDETRDVVVVGLGAAGAAAALEAAGQELEVTVLERFSGGGATALSGGIVYAGGGTRIQREAGVEDDPGQMLEYLKLEVGDAVSEATLRDFCDTSADTLAWLEKHGVSFDSRLCPYKTSYPNNNYYLYYSGNESFRPYADAARPAPRGHRAAGKSLGGASLFEPLRNSLSKSGVELRYRCRAEGLIAGADGRVTGVEYLEVQGQAYRRLHGFLENVARSLRYYLPAISKRCIARCREIESSHSRLHRIKARRAVILAAGGFIYNRAMVEEIAPAYRPGMPLGTPGDDGSGILLGRSAGAATGALERISAWRFINPPAAWTEGIIVDRSGHRYINEMMYGATIGRRMVEEHRGECFLLIDARIRRESLRQLKPGEVQWFQQAPALINLFANSKRGDTPEQAAQAAGVDPQGLRDTLRAYNDCAHGSREDPLHKPTAAIRPIEEGPFYIIDASLNSARWLCPTLTLGGLKVCENSGAVLREDGSAIAGLYAAGRNAVGICSNGYLSGLSIADCIYAGRRAGRNAAATHGSEP